MTRLVLGLVVGVALAPAQGAAQDEGDTLDDEARALFEAGRMAYASARYEDALDRFQEAYRLSQRPGLLFNIASAADRLRRDHQALEAYRRYVEAVPEGRQADMARERISVIERARRHSTILDLEDAGDEDRPPAGGGSVTDEAWFWVLIVGVTAAVAAGVAIGIAVAASGSSTEAPIPGSFGRVVMTLELP